MREVVLPTLVPLLRTLLATATIALVPLGARAITVTVTDPNPTYVATRADCMGYFDSKPYKDCKSTASIAAASIGGADAEFKKSFDAWNAGLANDKKWTLVDGGKLPGGELKVTVFDAYVTNTTGGVEINVVWEYDESKTGIAKDLFKWSQGLRDNYITSPAKMVPLFYEMDVGGSTTSPLYPFQYADRHFYDRPVAPLTEGTFIAKALLARVDDTFRTLTTYEGVAYEFQLSGVVPVPEPGTAGLLGLGGLGLLMWSVRRRAAHRPA